MVFFFPMHDYHLHTNLCKHAEGGMAEYIESAIQKGITEICFTDHMPMPDGFDSEHRMSLENMDTYLEQINLMKRVYREISILVGIEVDYIERYERFIEKFLKNYPFDLVIMAVHYIPRWPKNQWVFEFDYDRQTIKKQYRDYFAILTRGIRTGLFDVVGHFDIVKRPRFPVVYTVTEDVFGALEAVRKAEMSIELNTSGLRKTISETYPALEVVELAANRDIPIVFSSDAHKPGDVGYEFDYLLNVLFQLPHLKVAHYRNRNRVIRTMVQPNPE